MCTVTYIPSNDNAFAITHNRDESITRLIASPPVRKIIGGVQHFYPVDMNSMGTWFGVSETGRVASLLNGGSKKHVHSPPYKHSRGSIIPDYFSYPAFLEFYRSYDFNGLEPFTLLIFEAGEIFELIVDEDRIEYRKINPDTPFIYSSSTLYPLESRLARRNRFQEWMKIGKETDQKSILEFHHDHIFEKETHKSKMIGGHILRTVSITSLLSTGSNLKLDYLDLLNDMQFSHSLINRSAFMHRLDG